MSRSSLCSQRHLTPVVPPPAREHAVARAAEQLHAVDLELRSGETAFCVQRCPSGTGGTVAQRSLKQASAWVEADVGWAHLSQTFRIIPMNTSGFCCGCIHGDIATSFHAASYAWILPTHHAFTAFCTETTQNAAFQWDDPFQLDQAVSPRHLKARGAIWRRARRQDKLALRVLDVPAEKTGRGHLPARDRELGLLGPTILPPNTAAPA